MINVAYRLSNYRGIRNRKAFMASVPILPPISPRQKLGFDVYSFSGERDWPEQLGSIRSFLRFAGEPERFIVVSDGTHTRATRAALESSNRAVSVVAVSDFCSAFLPEVVTRFAAVHPLGKKLAMLMSIPPDRPSVYADSDVLFFSGASRLPDLLDGGTSWYAADCTPSLDLRVVPAGELTAPYVNSGFLILNGALGWERFCESLNFAVDAPNHFTEQSIVHVVMRSIGAKVLPGHRFILQDDDQFALFDRYIGNPDVVLRHYVGPTRRKFWHHVRMFS